MARSRNHTPLSQLSNREVEREEYSSDNPFVQLGEDIGHGTSNSIADIGKSIFDSFLHMGDSNGSEKNQFNPENQEFPPDFNLENATRPRRNERITLFSLQERREREEVQQIRELLKQLKEEIKAIRQANAMMMSEVDDVEKLTFETDPKSGVYHIRFLELMIKLLRSIRAKVGESRTWMNVLKSKKAKRGSLFAKRSKEMGTEYSQSMELSNARATG